MSRPAPRTLTAYDHLSGPPGSGKTAALAAQIDAASRRKGLSPEVQAHLADSADTLNQALAARLLRSGA